jgi:hypothetical protein
MVVLTLITSIVKRYFSAGLAIGLVFSLLFIAITTYDTECLVKGQCIAWSWIRTILYILFPTIIIIMTIFALSTKDSSSEQPVYNEDSS